MKVHEGGRKRTLSRDIEKDAPPTKKSKETSNEYSCSICDIKFSRKFNMQRHNTTKHGL